MLVAGSGRQLGLAWAALVGTLLLAQYTDVDLWLQELLYRRDQQRWWIDSQDPWLRLWFYSGPKGALIAIGVALLAVVVAAWRGWLARHWLRPALYLLLCLGLIPALISAFKAITHIPCPSQLTLYQGQLPYRHLWEATLVGEQGRCFPAGHASGGFALMGLAFVGRQRWQRMAGALIALATGWTMGLYQMMKGAHFLSHTLVTFCLAWLMALVLARSMGNGRDLLDTAHQHHDQDVDQNIK
ncbi:MAG: phosphatase PAP2 family protein [Magnetococcales bacterium]|nr:phosphatase PAP2 family protein [Magnetococcales bacterium]